jgi:hypothetical protein
MPVIPDTEVALVGGSWSENSQGKKHRQFSEKLLKPKGLGT